MRVIGSSRQWILYYKRFCCQYLVLTNLAKFVIFFEQSVNQYLNIVPQNFKGALKELAVKLNLVHVKYNFRLK